MKNYMQVSKPMKAKVQGAPESARTRLITGQGAKVTAVAKVAKPVDAGICMPADHPSATTTRTVKSGTQEFMG